MLNRSRMIEQLAGSPDPWDILVIGGGATGLSTALEAASRGHRTALVEARDFAEGTSSRSTKLIHGGVRYLRQGRIGMVRQSLVERERLLRNAPEIVRPLNFVLPGLGFSQRLINYTGLRLYDLLAGRLFSGCTRWLSRIALSEQMPTLRTETHRGGLEFTDAQFDDARLAISLAATAAQQGAVLANHLPVTRLIVDGSRVAGAVVVDRESSQEFTLRARVVVNATGVFAEHLMQMDESLRRSEAQRPRIVASQGSHIVVDAKFLPGRTAVLIPKTDDGRILFAIPWLTSVLIGTTDLQFPTVAIEPRPLPNEVSYLLEHAARFLSPAPTESDIRSKFSGLRPLVGGKAGRSSSSLSREHDISISPAGMITVIGGKWTTCRHMGEELINVAESVASLPRLPSVTATLPLDGGSNSLVHFSPDMPIEGPILERLPYCKTNIVHAVRHEMARTLSDVLARRTRCLFLDARATEAAAPIVADIMRQELNQTEQWERQQLADFRTLAAGY